MSLTLYSLAHAFDRGARKRNFILVNTIALSVMLLFALLSLVKGRAEVDRIKTIRENGVDASVVLDKATVEQVQRLKELNYVQEVSAVREFGLCCEDKRIICTCAYVNEEDFQGMFAPAYENLQGSYPENVDEVMLSVRVLKSMGIEEPTVGMKIPMYLVRYDWLFSGAQDLERDFYLSGYYTDFTTDALRLPTAYFSQALLQEWGIGQYPVKVFMKADIFWLGREQIEELFYQDVSLDAEQRFEVIREEAADEIRKIAGGYAVAIAGIIWILFSIDLFLYHIFSTAVRRDRRNYALLKTIGAVSRQIWGIFILQSGKLIIAGSVIGAALGSLAVEYCVLPLIEKMYLTGMGSTKQIHIYSWKLLALSLILNVVGVFMALLRGILPLMKCSPIKGLSEVDITYGSKRQYKRTKAITIASLFFGMEAVLLSVMISNGLDMTHEIARNPDFEIGITREAVDAILTAESGEYWDKIPTYEELLPEDLMHSVSEVTGIDRKDMISCEGGFGFFSRETSPALRPRLDSYYSITDVFTGLTVQVVNDEWVDDLEQYVRREGLSIDMEGFRQGGSFILLHSHELSRQQSEAAEKAIDKPLTCYLFNDYTNKPEPLELVCSGYLDLTQSAFPTLNIPWDGRKLYYIIISEQTRESLQMQPVIYHISFSVREEAEQATKKMLQSIVAEANQNAAVCYLISNSDTLASAQNYIFATRIVMGVFSGILIALAFINFSNAMMTEIITRRIELTVLWSIGMTRKQMKRMLMREGFYYCIVTLALLLSVGSLIMAIVGKVIKMQVSYFVFHYPIFTLLFLTGILFLLCMLIATLMTKTSHFVTSLLRNCH